MRNITQRIDNIIQRGWFNCSTILSCIGRWENDRIPPTEIFWFKANKMKILE